MEQPGDSRNCEEVVGVFATEADVSFSTAIGGHLKAWRAGNDQQEGADWDFCAQVAESPGVVTEQIPYIVGSLGVCRNPRFLGVPGPVVGDRSGVAWADLGEPSVRDGVQ